MVLQGMKNAMLMVEGAVAAFPGGPWSFVILVLLILFVTLVATDGPKNKDN